MSITLYFAPRTRSTRPRWLLEELDVPYDLHRLDLSKGEHKRPEYLAIHPHGVVPALRDDDLVMIESLAILMYLADKYPEKGLAPKLGTPERARYYQWMFYMSATIEPRMIQFAMNRDGDTEAAAEAKQGIYEVASVLTKALDGKPYILGDRFSAADVALGSALSWGRSMGLLQNHPQLDAYVKALAERPAFKRAQT